VEGISLTELLLPFFALRDDVHVFPHERIASVQEREPILDGGLTLGDPNFLIVIVELQ